MCSHISETALNINETTRNDLNRNYNATPISGGYTTTKQVIL